MPTFICFLNWTDQGAKNAKEANKRFRASKSLAEKLDLMLNFRIKLRAKTKSASWLSESRLRRAVSPRYAAVPTVSAITAPRAPSGLSCSTVESRAV
jgi:hypothetical protein